MDFAKKIFITVFMTSIALWLANVVWVRASFIEPDFAPTSSDQDFAQNILGANNANNDFDSSSVVANNDGSILERLEYLSSPLSKDFFYEGGEPYYCSKIGVDVDGQATTSTINEGLECGSSLTCVLGTCQ